ncbi:MAG: hypothetical protein EAX96_04120 [Candidatus Lokiarchaeota archaeon]|nr:hypothetical protein [Candidatus Lokiarchaeota archaeon]
MDFDYLNLIALCLSDGGIGFSKEALYIHFTNKSEVLLDLFRKEIKKFSSNKIHRDEKPRGITLKVFDQVLIKKLLNISPSYRTKACNKRPICPILKDKFNYKIGYHQHINYNDLKY